MTGTSTPVICPWCEHETTDTDAFRTHLMVEHRKSQLAAYVLEAQRTATPTEPVERSTTATEEVEDETEREREVVAR